MFYPLCMISKRYYSNYFINLWASRKNETNFALTKNSYASLIPFLQNFEEKMFEIN